LINILPYEKADVLSKYKDLINELEVVKFAGKVDRIDGFTIESIGPAVKYGDLCKIKTDKNQYLYAEVVGLHKNRVILMPIGDMKGVVAGAEVYAVGTSLSVSVGPELLGRVISGIGRPLDKKGEIFTKTKYPIDGRETNPLDRRLITEPLSVGIRSIDSLLTVGRGQRIGIFAGSGVGKSTVIGMIARYTDADVNVIALIGERQREALDFVAKELGADGLKKSVVVIATADQSPMVRLRGAFLAHTIGEYFRDQGLSVNLLMDSVTRFAMAQREVGLAAGEPSATRGYPPSVFSMMPKLLERAGTRGAGGSITGFYSILVEGDDMNEPIADAARGILDGHIVLDRKLANKGHYPAVNILESISRCMKDVVDEKHLKAANIFRELLSAYTEAEDLINLGGYVRGANPVVDRAISLINDMNNFLKQGIYERNDFTSIKEKLISMMIPEEKKSRTARAANTPAFARINI